MSLADTVNSNPFKTIIFLFLDFMGQEKVTGDVHTIENKMLARYVSFASSISVQLDIEEMFLGEWWVKTGTPA